ncbi:NAD-binding protein [Beduinella massiliensis]|uniref:NAD-binding protein n=1 Tax=Beduinella massiliensis TaxID=1852363 RepID=UPI000C841E04
MRSMLVIGLGRFGRHLATKLAELGNEVMVVDRDEAAVSRLAPVTTAAHIGDCMDEEVIASLGVRNFDVCFVCISENFQSSLEITSLLKEAGAKWVVSKTDREMHAKFLLKIGADAVVHPERDMAQRAAMKYSMRNAFDYIEVTPEYAISELRVPESWVGQSVRDLKVRSRYNVNIIGIKVEEHVIPLVSAEHRFEAAEHLLVAGGKKDITRLMYK